MKIKLKCPFCGEELDWCLSCPLPTMSCPNHNCKAYDFLMTQNCWQALIQSLKDRKELAIKLAQTAQNLEQSEKCCSAWETQALDYKAETIALSGKLEIARKALEEMQHWLGVVRCSMISHLNNQNNTLLEYYETDPTVQNIDKAKSVLKHYLEQIEHKE